jgi:hypothetical protein
VKVAEASAHRVKVSANRAQPLYARAGEIENAVQSLPITAKRAASALKVSPNAVYLLLLR